MAKQDITTEMIERRNKVLVAVSNLTGVPVDDIMGAGQSDRVVIARYLTMWVLHDIYRFTMMNIGTLMHRHYSTVIYAVKTVNSDTYKDITNFKNKLRV